MTVNELKRAFLDERPVAFGGITYQKITAVIYRKTPDGKGLHAAGPERARRCNRGGGPNQFCGGDTMTQEIRTITIGAGQARPRRRSQKHTRRRVRLNGWTVAKYAALTVAGVLLFRAGAAYALTERGYKAIGGEVFALFLPVFYYTISATVRDYIKEIKSIFREEKDHEKTC